MLRLRNSTHGRLADARWGLRYGLMFTVPLILLVIGVGFLTRWRSTSEVSLSPLGIAVWYLGAGVSGGLVLGMCRRIIHKPLGAALDGFLVVAPAMSAIVAIAAPSLSLWRWLHATLLISIASGPVWALAT